MKNILTLDTKYFTVYFDFLSALTMESRQKESSNRFLFNIYYTDYDNYKDARAFNLQVLCLFTSILWKGNKCCNN